MFPIRQADCAHALLPLGMEVEGGKPFTQDWDHGVVLDNDIAKGVLVGWAGSATQTWEPGGGLTGWDGVEKWYVADLDLD